MLMCDMMHMMDSKNLFICLEKKVYAVIQVIAEV